MTKRLPWLILVILVLKILINVIILLFIIVTLDVGQVFFILIFLFVFFSYSDIDSNFGDSINSLTTILAIVIVTKIVVFFKALLLTLAIRIFCQKTYINCGRLTFLFGFFQSQIFVQPIAFWVVEINFSHVGKGLETDLHFHINNFFNSFVSII